MTFAVLLIFLSFAACVSPYIPIDDTAVVEPEPELETEPELDTTENEISDSGVSIIDTQTIAADFIVTDTVSQEVADFIPPPVRVLLQRNVRELSALVYGRAVLKTRERSIRLPAGSIRFIFAGDTVRVTGHGRRAGLSLPCTLTTNSGSSVIDIDEQTYRGGLILHGDSSGMMVINSLSAEEYLRGVVPLEIGQRSIQELEAMKAQAVAARTYTYKKIVERSGGAYDVAATVNDQVYGGVNAEYRGSDLAVRETARQVLYGQEGLVDAFYHSTCGGHTANIADVWRSESQLNLQSVEDARSSGLSWCAHSPRYSWRETWSREDFERIIKKYSRTIAGFTPFSGSLTDIVITETSACGRVTKCRITSPQGEWTYGGDRIRQLFRIASDESLLHSARFSLNLTSDSVVAAGRGFGHGIGMCQMGAIGRARSGQSYRDILMAYYSGAKIKKIGDEMY
ncbi:MAG: SpoIID/LytB domain-containing protein [Fibrobacterota bacterium]